jgi:hypothetical protein
MSKIGSRQIFRWISSKAGQVQAGHGVNIDDRDCFDRPIARRADGARARAAIVPRPALEALDPVTLWARLAPVQPIASKKRAALQCRLNHAATPRSRGNWLRHCSLKRGVTRCFSPKSLSKRAPSTTRTSLRVCRINGLRASGRARNPNCVRELYKTSLMCCGSLTGPPGSPG